MSADDDEVSNVVSITKAPGATAAIIGAVTGAKPSNSTVLNAHDTVSHRLAQISGVLIAIANTYDDEEEGYDLPPQHLRNALWAVSELHRQAEAAYEVILARGVV